MAQGKVVESARRRYTGRRADTMLRLTDAAMEVLREVGFHDLTLQMVGERAGMTRATAYTYFASKDHLIAEVFRRRMVATTFPLPDSSDVVERVVAALRRIALIVADEPALAAAITAVFNSSDPEIEAIRIQLYDYVHTVMVAAVGDDGDDETVSMLEIAYLGAMMRGVFVPGFKFTVGKDVEKLARRILAAG